LATPVLSPTAALPISRSGGSTISMCFADLGK
jgi:hypothetical protein